RAPELLGLGGGEARRHHRHPQELFLEERHAKRAPEDRLQGRVRIGDGLPSAPTANVGVDHLTHDRPRADDRDLHDEVVEPPAAITIPPECWPRWRGRSWIRIQSAAKWRMRGWRVSQPASARCFVSWSAASW